MIKIIKGFRDILPTDILLWQEVENIARKLFASFGFCEIRVPIMEKTELFARSIGADTDIVEKEMYTFADRKGEMLTLRPEATAGVVRAFIEHNLSHQDSVQKLFTMGPMFRRERPQKGRFRQFSQINAEFFGVAAPFADILVIELLHRLFDELKVTQVTARINSLGCPACRPAYKQALLEHLSGKMENLCENCCRRSATNPLRVLDCKSPSCIEAAKDAPAMREHLCDECSSHYRQVLDGLARQGVPFEQDDKLVRGLDYYTKTTFEFQTTMLGAQNAVAGGGRYDGLVAALGGPETPAVGFAVGQDRLIELLSAVKNPPPKGPDIFLACLGEKAALLGFDWMSSLCRQGIWAEMDYSSKSLKSQMKRADKSNARFVLMVGENEIKEGRALLRRMTASRDDTTGQEEITLDGNLVDTLIKKVAESSPAGGKG
ncbi:MAG: histidine--tRNA ligase [Desulfatibacillaceae bacterium]|nr:histidine--tRNA ligase [Desulfatibacillaceae bacterium]